MSEKSEPSDTSARNSRIDATARELFVAWCSSRPGGPPSESNAAIIARGAYAFATALEESRANAIRAEEADTRNAEALDTIVAARVAAEFDRLINDGVRVSGEALASASAPVDDAQKRAREIDRVICDHGHVSDQVRDLQRAVLRMCETLDVLVDVAQLDRPHNVFDAIRRLVAHEVGRHSGDPITWVPKRESPFRAEDE